MALAPLLCQFSWILKSMKVKFKEVWLTKTWASMWLTGITGTSNSFPNSSKSLRLYVYSYLSVFDSSIDTFFLPWSYSHCNWLESFIPLGNLELVENLLSCNWNIELMPLSGYLRVDAIEHFPLIPHVDVLQCFDLTEGIHKRCRWIIERGVYSKNQFISWSISIAK